jgi:hypothetical protein
LSGQGRRREPHVEVDERLVEDPRLCRCLDQRVDGRILVQHRDRGRHLLRFRVASVGLGDEVVESLGPADVRRWVQLSDSPLSGAGSSNSATQTTAHKEATCPGFPKPAENRTR